MSKPLLVAGVTLSLLAAGCAGESQNGSAKAQPKDSAYRALATPAPAASAPAMVAAGDTRSGKALVDGTKRSLYLFEKDKKNRSACSGNCAKAWPPYTTNGTVQAGPGIKGDLLGTFKRHDGATQVSYNGRPLYYYIKDQNPGDATGQDVKDHGGEWYLVTPEGKKLHKRR